MRTPLVACLLALATTSALAQESQPATKAQETKGTPAERANQILQQLTLDEKISLLSGTGFTTRPIPRLGIPAFTMSDGPNGVRNGPNNQNRACAFPAGVALAATFDPELAAAYGRAVALEARARGTHFQLGPGVNICRIPINGRNFEYFGEDPYLASVIAAEWCKACTAEGVVPTIKHFAANNQETNRNSVDAVVEERVLHEIYLPAFKAAVEGVQARRDGRGVLSVMCSYNRLNGHYASNNDWLLNDVLKKQWGFTGLVMSDWGASHDVTDVACGLDLEMPNNANLSPQKIKAALDAGTVKQSDIDNAVRRSLYTAFAEGWLDTGWEQRNTSLPVDAPESHKIALGVANSAIVLLKNANNLLPLDRSRVKTVVVVGPNATGGTGPNGQPALPANIGGGGSGLVIPFETHNADADYLAGITRAAGPNVKVVYLPAPEAPNVGMNTFPFARTSAAGEAGLTLTVEPAGPGDAPAIAPTVQKGINLTWEPGQLPFGVPAGRDATFTWVGMLVPPHDADLQVRATPGVNVSIGDQGYPDGTIVNLKKDMPTPIRITALARATPSANRGRGGGNPAGGPTTLRAALVPPAIPDLAQAKDADAVVVCVGFNRNTETEGRDRPFDLPAIQQYLLRKVAEANPRTVVINNSGAALGIANWQDSAAAILQAWYLGQAGGTAIGNVLFGDVNPSGKLASTFDKTWEENPAYAYYPGRNLPGQNYPTEPYTEGLFYGYRGYDKADKVPLYPFGFGLSYTTFELSDMRIIPGSDTVQVSATLTNTGSRPGAQVVQLYVGEPNAPIPRPKRELKAFTKITLAPGEFRSFTLSLPKSAFAYWSPDTKSWTVTPNGTYTIEIGTSARDLPLRRADFHR
jgi:beta-glucosidase